VIDARMIVNVEVAVVRQDGRYLMIVRGDDEEFLPGVLVFPGGGLDPELLTDALEATAIRELREEVGLEVSETRYVESHTFLAGEELVFDVVMLARYAGGEPFAADPGEVAGVRWMSIAEIHAHPDVQPWTRTSLDRAERVRREVGW